MNKRYSRQEGTVPRDTLKGMYPTVIGIGAIGRNVALQLASIGVTKMQLIDFDIVEEPNIASQGYYEEDLGTYKVDATAKLCKAINKNIEIDILRTMYRRTVITGNIIFACVDTMKARKFIFGHEGRKADLFIDGRMSAEVLRVIHSEPGNSKFLQHYESTLFSDDEAYRGSCTAKSTIYCANIAAGFMVSTFAKWLRGVPQYNDIIVNLLTNEMNEYKD